MLTRSPSPLSLNFVRHLTRNPVDHPHGQAHVSAASGLVGVRPRLYVVAGWRVG